MGLTAGIYTGSGGILSAIFPDVNIILIIVFLFAVEILIAAGAVYRQGDTCPHFKTRLLIFVIIPFLILFFTGDMVAASYKSGEDSSIFLKIYDYEKRDNELTGNMTIEGRVSNHPRLNYGKLVFLLAADKVYISGPGVGRERFLKADDFINVKISGPEGLSISRDDYLSLNGVLKKTDSRDTGNNIKSGDIVFEADYKNAHKINCYSLSYKLFSLRSRVYECIKNAFYSYLKIENACIAEALILGNRNNVPDYITDSFKRCGLFHLFAISGLHLSFFLSLIFLIFKRTEKSIFLFWSVIIFLAVYNFLIGEKASTLRASVMAVFILLAGRAGREFSYRIILYITYIILIIYNPFFIYNTGFWMTFISMAALVFIYPVILGMAGNFPVQRGGRAGLFLMKTIFITISIQAALFPVLAYFFGEVPLAAVIANVFVLPAFYPFLFILMVSSLVIIIWPPLGGIILRAGNIFILYILKTAGFLGRFDYLIINFENFGKINFITYYLVFIAVLILIRKVLGRADTGKWEF